MKCYFDENGNPKVDVTVIGLDKEVRVSALIDTGSQVQFMLSLEQAVSIGLKLVAVTTIELADGSVKKEHVFGGASVVLGRQKIPVEIMLTPGESLLGISLLKQHLLTIDFSHNRITLAPS